MAIKCPKCGGKNIARYLYGLPHFDEKHSKDFLEALINPLEHYLNIYVEQYFPSFSFPHVYLTTITLENNWTDDKTVPAIHIEIS